jgi:hypothetical protein
LKGAYDAEYGNKKKLHKDFSFVRDISKYDIEIVVDGGSDSDTVSDNDNDNNNDNDNDNDNDDDNVNVNVNVNDNENDTDAYNGYGMTLEITSAFKEICKEKNIADSTIRKLIEGKSSTKLYWDIFEQARTRVQATNQPRRRRDSQTP